MRGGRNIVYADAQWDALHCGSMCLDKIVLLKIPHDRAMVVHA